MPPEIDGPLKPLSDEPPRDGGLDGNAGDAEPLRLEPVRPQTTARQYGLIPRWLGIALVAIVAGGSLFLAGFTLGARVATTPGTPASLEQEFSAFWDVYNAIKDKYAGGARPSDQDLIKGAIKGMLESLNDRWSFYQDPQDFQNTNLNVGGHDQGIGVLVQLQGKTSATCSGDTVGPDCELAIVKPIPGSPAEKAGIQPGDVIAAVDGKTLDGLTIGKITPLIKGPQGTKVTLTLQRGAQTIQLTITRSIFDQPEVDTKVLANGAVQYIDVAAINDVAAGQFHGALKQALDAGRHLFIIDLRGNPGGMVNSAVAMASEFMSSGVVVYQQDATGNVLSTSASAGGLGTDPSNKVVVLVDKNTASAAEILAAALEANGRAKLVGQTTFGKGVAQVYLPLPDNLGGFHLTVARWLTPNKVWINGKGLTPDIPVDTSNARAGTDPVVDAALIHLGQQPEPAPSASPSAPAPSKSPAPSPAPSPTPAPSLGPSPTPSLAPSPS